jgi:hypothetical protein
MTENKKTRAKNRKRNQIARKSRKINRGSQDRRFAFWTTKPPVKPGWWACFDLRDGTREAVLLQRRAVKEVNDVYQVAKIVELPQIFLWSNRKIRRNERFEN